MLPEKITREMFDKLVSLAALELNEEESEYLRTELNHQLAAVKELSEIPIDEDVQPSLHGIDCQGNPPRPDEWQPFPDPDAILALAPERERRYFVVPEIAHLSEEGQ